MVWENIYNTNIEVIDNQHKAYVATLNKLYEAIELPESIDKLNEIFQRLADYIHFHFATEEKYFAEFNYEGATEHIAAHNKFKRQIAEYQGKLSRGEIDFTNDLVEYLDDWLANHVMDLDRKYIICFKEHGLK